MAKLELEMIGFHDKIDFVSINGKRPKISKNDNGNRYCVIETSEPKAEIVMFKAHHYIGKNWFWWQLLYFFVSLFGLFDIRQDKKCLVVDCRFTIDVNQDTKVVVKRANFEDGGKYLDIETTANVEVSSNKQYIDKEAQKKHKKMKKIKAAITICTLILAIVLVVFL